MGFWTLFEVASMPLLQVLIVSSLGALMATEYLNLLHSDARKSLNRIVFTVFTPSLVFASLAQTVTLEDIISWWFMPVNIGITFLCGGILGWIAVKILKPKPYLEGLIIATCSSANLGNLPLIIVPAICRQDGSPFGDHSVCASVGVSYASFSMALGGFFVWTFTYQLLRSSALRYKAFKAVEEVSKEPNNDLEANEKSRLLEGEIQDHVAIVVQSTEFTEANTEKQVIIYQQSSTNLKTKNTSFFKKIAGILRQFLKEILAPSTIGASLGFIFGEITWLRNLVIGDDAPLRVIHDCISLLGDGNIPCITLILGGNLTQGLRKARLNPFIIIAVIFVRYVILPAIGIGVVKAASHFGWLPSDLLFHFVLMIQFTLPPAMNIGTITQLFDVANEECAVILMWTYLVATLSLTVWSTVFMWILS